jgi:hypothetical protein
MGTTLALGLAAAVYPQLLAVVVIILTRPGARQLLWACYVGAIACNIGCVLAVYAVFNARETVAGTSASRLGGLTYLVIGIIGLVIAGLAATERGRRAFGPALRRDHGRPPADGRSRLPASVHRVTGASARVKTRAEGALRRGSLPVAAVVGVILGIPGPFDFLAVGHIARSGYETIAAVVTVVVFTLVKFLLIEVPIVSYLVNPDGTAVRVDQFAAWMKANTMSVVAGVVAVISVVLIVRGVGRL